MFRIFKLVFIGIIVSWLVCLFVDFTLRGIPLAEARFGLLAGNGYIEGRVCEDIGVGGVGVNNGVCQDGEPNFHSANPVGKSYNVSYVCVSPNADYPSCTNVTGGSLYTNANATPSTNFTTPQITPSWYTLRFNTIPGMMVYTSTQNPNPVNAGFMPAGSTQVNFAVRVSRLRGIVWEDVNRSTSFQAGEFGLIGRVLTSSPPGTSAITTSITNPNYEVITQGGFIWQTDTPTPREEWITTKPNYLTSGGSMWIAPISIPTTRMAVDFGLYHTPVIEGRVCDDINKNKLCDAGEPNLGGADYSISFTSTGRTGTIAVPLTNPASGLCLGCNYTSTDARKTVPVYDGANSLNSITLPVGKVLNNATPPPYNKTLTYTSPDNRWRQDFALTYIASSIGGYVWDDSLTVNKVKDAGETTINGTTETGFSVALFDSGGLQVGSPVNVQADGSYNFDSVEVANDYEVQLTTPANKFCRGESGWNNAVTAYSYETAVSPYETGSVIDVAAGVKSTANLGVVTDYALGTTPSDEIWIRPGESGDLVLYAIPDPCWVGTSVEALFEPVGSWPSGISISYSPSNPASINPNAGPPVDPPLNRIVVSFDVDSGVTEGEYEFNFTVTSTGTYPRTRVLNSFINVGTKATPGWLTVIDGDTYVHCTTCTNGIYFTMPPASSGGYENFFTPATISNWTPPYPRSGETSLGGIPIARSAIKVAKAGGGDNLSAERGGGVPWKPWELSGYSLSADFIYTESMFAGLEECNPSMRALNAGRACFYNNPSGLTNYKLHAPGVTLVYVDSDNPVIDQNMYSDNPNNQHLILVFNGDLTITAGVGTKPPAMSNPADIDAAIIILGGHNLTIEPDVDGQKQLKISGPVLVSGEIHNDRYLTDKTVPSVVFDDDPALFMDLVPILGEPRLITREVNPVGE